MAKLKTVEQLIIELQQFDKELPVYLIEPSDAYKSIMHPVATTIEGKAHNSDNNVKKCIILTW